MFQIACCDDEYKALQIYPKYIKSLFEMQQQDVHLELYQHSGDLLSAMHRGKHYDVVFLDIDMPHQNGIELGVALRKTGRCKYIIYLSNHTEYVYRSFQVRPYRFVRKDHFQEELDEAVRSLLKEEANSRPLVFNTGTNRCFRTSPNSIKYIECRNKNQIVVTTDDSFVIRNTLGELEEMLSGYGFMRIHKGFLVNPDYIKSVNPSEVALETGENLPLSRRRGKMILQELERLCFAYQ